ncbi:hypothetical protein I302_102302 [Kwoniella bestiolae CBS 10118]|uniref:Uncharacterized protein n=1 Tax=Kwoniella bestiolae CBS 10118 TaxID=1296100 RepID=A0A1B9GEQ6_9TREE|nr:hypothetical protein I302_00994 [Kwoniella bestiolae CBS 10118]OCF29488.1 hypothetical protein I302_00994 [Kwoniella bestiolae CBS 10118]
MTSPLSPPCSSSQPTKLDTEALATLIRQLKRSPESPSRLTLPPIMGVIDEQDEEDDAQTTRVIVEEVDSASNSSTTPSPDTLSDRSGLYDIPEEDEDEESSIEQIDRNLWVINEESEEENTQKETRFDGCVDDEDETHGDENTPPNSTYSPPVDPYSPPPPSPCMTHIPSPTLPDDPSIPINLTYECYPEEAESSQSTCGKESSPLSEVTSSSDQFSDAETEQQEEGSSSVTPYYDSSIILPQRRRRRTLGELEQYRKFAMNKAAWKSYQEAKALEEQRRIREREEREGLWMKYRYGGREQWSDRPDLITRAQSFPPTTRTNTEPIFATLYAGPSSDTANEEGFTPTPSFTSSWYIDDIEDGDEDQIQHVEYVSSPQYFSSIVHQNQDEEEEVFSPVSEQIQTPALPTNESRRFFPSATQIFGSPSSSYPSYDSTSTTYEEEPVITSPTYGLGLGLGLSGMTSTQTHRSKPNMGMSFDQMIKYEEGKQTLEEDEISLVELPIRVIFPERTFEEFKAAGREYTRKYKEEQNNQKDSGSLIESQPESGHEQDSQDRCDYREDLDGLPIPERGRSRSRIRRDEDMEARSTESYLTYTYNSSGSTSLNYSIEDHTHPKCFSTGYMSDIAEREERGSLIGHDEVPNRTDSTSPDSPYSSGDEHQELDIARRFSASPEDMNPGYLGEEEEVAMDSRRRHSAPGKLPSYCSEGMDELKEDMEDELSLARVRPRSECSNYV